MFNFSFNLCLWVYENSGFIPVAVVLASLNMLIQIAFSVIFGSKGLSKIGGYRGD